MRFVTVFPDSMNFVIRKDVGMIPYLLQEEMGYTSTLVSYKNEEEFDLRNVESLNLDFIPRKYGELIDVLLYLTINYKKIDILNCYHYSYKSLIYLNYFNFLKKNKGLSFLKLDANDTILEHPSSKIKRKIYEYFLKKIDIISIETKGLYNKLIKKFPNLIYLPNGFYDFEKSDRVEEIQKENIFLNVARLDDPGKSTFTIIEGFSIFTSANPEHTWKLRLIGPYGEEFKTAFNEYVEKNTQIKDKIELLGPIYDPIQLKNYYKESSVFILASLSESFGLVYVEALQYGCYILTTPLTSAFDITDNGKFGDFFEKKDSNALATKMKDVINRELTDLSKEATDFAFSNFYWLKILENLNYEIKKRYQKK